MHKMRDLCVDFEKEYNIMILKLLFLLGHTRKIFVDGFETRSKTNGLTMCRQCVVIVAVAES